MATFTIKIDSEDLARDVLSHFGCLDEDDVPDLISDEEEGEEELFHGGRFFLQRRRKVCRPDAHCGSMLRRVPSGIARRIQRPVFTAFSRR